MIAAPLPFGLTEDALAAAAGEDDPSSLGAATRLRSRFGVELAAAALTQTTLRRRARTKFGDAADDLFWTRDGLEQATRPEVADRHAARFVAAGVRRVVDLGCGLGSDAMAFARAGLDVLAVELDPGTADAARANLARTTARTTTTAEVRCADVADVLGTLGDGDAVFADPARRDARGRLWRVSDFNPDLSLVLGLAAGGRRALGVKLGPALPHSFVPDDVEAEWVSHHGDVVEAALWSGPGATVGRWSALVLTGDVLVGDASKGRRLVATAATVPVRVLEVGCFLYEPDGAVIRARAVGTLGERLGAGLVDPQIAYLVADEHVVTPYATAYEVLEVLAFDLKALRRWVREHGVGTLEIKKRGLDVDPAALRRDLRPHGPGRATLVLTRTPHGARTAVVRRVR